MKRACVIGWPISHSRSPLIHGYWIDAYGIDGTYTSEAVEPENLKSFIDHLAAGGFAGCNVTVPHKEAVFKLADVKDPSAEAVGAANTVWLEAGKRHCMNTDTYGFMANLNATVPGWQQHDGDVVVLGAGGAARAIVYGFLEAGVERVHVINRSFDRAEALAALFGNRVVAGAWEKRNRIAKSASVIVNTTTLGMSGQGDPGIDFSDVNNACTVSDLVYVPLETAFLISASRAGLKTVGGLGMLLHQAVPGFEKWFGVRPTVTDELYQRIARDVEQHV